MNLKKNNHRPTVRKRRTLPGSPKGICEINGIYLPTKGQYISLSNPDYKDKGCQEVRQLLKQKGMTNIHHYRLRDGMGMVCDIFDTHNYPMFMQLVRDAKTGREYTVIFEPYHRNPRFRMWAVCTDEGNTKSSNTLGDIDTLSALKVKMKRGEDSLEERNPF